jgi:phosphoribosyl-ATP pyrophosphohydrolase/phosphoribosyl-AMP cyclohydrolase
MSFQIEEVKFDERGLVPAIVQDAASGEVLTLAYMNAESLRRTLAEGETWFWSRSRAVLWHKGETSGNTQRVMDVKLDCDGDALVVLVEPKGPACHTGTLSCFHRAIAGPIKREGLPGLGATLERLYSVIEGRKAARPEGSYTSYLFEKGLDKILKKVGEEAAETIIAAKNAGSAELVNEVSDLLYHLTVLLVERGVSLDEVCAELDERSRK